MPKRKIKNNYSGDCKKTKIVKDVLLKRKSSFDNNHYSKKIKINEPKQLSHSEIYMFYTC